MLASPITILPGSDLKLVGHLSLADATLLAVIVLVPIGIVARPLRSPEPM
jgi:hypothetical protein